MIMKTTPHSSTAFANRCNNRGGILFYGNLSIPQVENEEGKLNIYERPGTQAQKQIEAELICPVYPNTVPPCEAKGVQQSS